MMRRRAKSRPARNHPYRGQGGSRARTGSGPKVMPMEVGFRVRFESQGYADGGQFRVRFESQGYADGG
jgi:hypothetical protein